MLLSPITKSSFLVSVNSIKMFWSTFSGIDDQAQSSEYHPGDGHYMMKVVGSRSLQDITVTSPYDPNLSRDVEELWKSYRCQRLTVVVQPMTCGDSDIAEPIGSPYVLNGCQLKGLKVAEADRSSGDVAEVSLTLTVDSWSRG